MRRKRLYLKRVSTGLLAAAALISSVPATAFAEPVNTGDLKQDGAAQERLLADFNFNSEESGFTGGGAKAEGNYTLVEHNGQNALHLDGNSQYLKVTDTEGGNLLTGKEEVTISYDILNERADTNWVFFIAPDDTEQSYEKEHYLGSHHKNGSVNVERYNGGSRAPVISASLVNEWAHIDVVVQKDVTRVFIDGKIAGAQESKFKLSDILGDESVFYIGKANWGTGGEYCQAAIDNFKVYDGVKEDLMEQIVQEAFESLDLGDLSAVESNLNLPEKFKGVDISWISDNESVIATDGTVTRPELDTEVILKAVLNLGNISKEKEFIAKVLRTDDAEALISRISFPYSTEEGKEVYGNITLPETVEGTGGQVSIEWETDHPEIINVNEIPNDGVYADDPAPAGTVTRPLEDTKVTMTAKVECRGDTAEKNFVFTVKAKPEAISESDYTDYFFAYFTGEGYTDGEQIYFSASQDGLHWEDLNDNAPVLVSTLGEKGVRDPFIIRSPEGDKFYLIATDLNINANGDWGRAQTAGSQSLMIWESTNLTDWSKQRMVEVSTKLDAGCTWAPEATYDETTGEYVVYWASKVKADNYGKQRIYYTKTRDFYSFTEPKVFIEKEHSTIDTTILKENGNYYRYSKNEDSKRVFAEKTSNLLHTDPVSISSPVLENQAGVEGPSIYKFNEDDVEPNGGQYCLLLDNYGRGGYYPMISSNLDGDFAEYKGNYKMPGGGRTPRHGTPIRVTAEEYKAIMKAYGNGNTEEPVQPNDDGLLARYQFTDENVIQENDTITIKDSSGNGKDALLEGNNGSIEEGILTLPGGNAGSDAAYLSIPGEIFNKQDTLTITLWLKNETGAGNYSAMFFGNPTRHIGGGTADYPLNYWLLNPSVINTGFFKSVWTDGDNANSPWTTETAVSSVKTGSDWAMYTTVITKDSIKGYYNGMEVSSSKKTKTTSDFGKNLVAYIGRSSYNDMFYKGGVRDVKIYGEAMPPDEVISEYYTSAQNREELLEADLQSAMEALTLGDTSSIKKDMELPDKGEKGSTITWKSSNQKILKDNGKVIRPKNKNTGVELTATLTLCGKSITKEFKVIVLADNAENRLNELVNALTIQPSKVTKDISLPDTAGENTTVVWKTSDVSYITNKGKVTRPKKGKDDVKVILTAEITYDDGADKLKADKEFEITVLAEAYGYIMAYTNNQEREDLGKSLHLAYSTDKKSYTALNSNTGVCFADNTGGSKNNSPNVLTSTYIFRKADGSYGLIATNNNNKKYVYVFDSKDLVNFTNERKLALSESKDVRQPVCSFDERENAYVIYWNDGSKKYKSISKDLKKVKETKEDDYKTEIVSADEIPDGAVPGNVLAVSKNEYDRVTDKLGVIKNIGVEGVNKKLGITVNVGEDITKSIPGSVAASYNDGSTTNLQVQWNEEDLTGIDTQKPGSYTVHGTVQQEEYANPFIEQRADPCILKGEDGYYYFTASYPMLGSKDPNGYDRVILRRSETIAGLKDAEEVTIWHCNDSAEQYPYIWAPELHYINGSYYIYYTSSVESWSTWGIRPHVLKCENAEDIMNPESWTEKGLFQATGTDARAFSQFSLDMTYFENNGHHYAVWAQTEGFSSLFIAEIDPDEPWKCISDSVIISVPQYSWERVAENVNEGASVLKKDGKIFLAFSASGTGPEYCVGLLTADTDADLLNPDSWEKTGYPVLTSADVPGEYGPGHNSFTVDENGNDIFVYHARGEECYNDQCQWAAEGPLYDPCRDARLKRVHWAADGTPILKMSYTEELAEEFKNVELTVSIKDDSTDPGDDNKDPDNSQKPDHNKEPNNGKEPNDGKGPNDGKKPIDNKKPINDADKILSGNTQTVKTGDTMHVLVPIVGVFMGLLAIILATVYLIKKKNR